MTRKKALIILGVLIVGAAVVAANLYLTRKTGPIVNVEALRSRDLEALVSASGKIQPKTQVNISANTTGKVTRLAVDEGQRVRTGQFLLEIDPKALSGQLERGEASVAAARSSLEQSQTALAQARATLDLAQQTLKRQQDLWKDGLTTKEALEKAQNDVTLGQASLTAREQEIEMRQQQIRQEQASLATTRYSLNQVILNSPIDGLVTRRNIEQGETAVMGTMNNAGTVLLTIADMSVLDAEVEVDETDIPMVSLGQQAKVTIDAIPDRTFKGHVTEIGNSPTQSTSTTQSTSGQRQATTFTVKVTLDEQVPDVRPGFTCTAEITTATRQHVVAVPIQSLTVREMLYNDKGELVHEPPPRKSGVEPTVAASTEPPPGHTRKETEGVFVLRDGRAVFVPVKVGIAGEKYFEVLSGPAAGDQVITGPFANVRALADGAEVRIADTPRSTLSAITNR